LLTSIADICLDIAGRCVVALYDNHRNIHSVIGEMYISSKLMYK